MHHAIVQIGVKTTQNSIHFTVNRKKCSVFNGYSDFGFQTKILFCLIRYAKVAIALHVYPVYIHSLPMRWCSCVAAVCHVHVPVPRWMMMCPCRRADTQAGMCNPPPGCTGVGRGGGMVSRTRGTPIYILIYILRFISLF